MSQDHPQPIQHPQLGDLTWDASQEWWQATVDIPARRKQIDISPEPDLQKHLALAANFVSWISANYDRFIATAADEAFLFDLIWDDELEEEELASMMSIHSVNVYGGALRVWFDMGGANTDHLIQTVLDEKHKITLMEK